MARECLADYLYWQQQDKKTLKRPNMLIKDIERNGYNCFGKPEPLKENLSGWWSLRVDDTKRLVSRIIGEGQAVLKIIQCRGHY